MGTERMSLDERIDAKSVTVITGLDGNEQEILDVGAAVEIAEAHAAQETEALAGEVFALASDALAWARIHNVTPGEPQPPTSARRAIRAVEALVEARAKETAALGEQGGDRG